MKFVFAILFLALSCSSVARAEIAIGLTAEWLTHESSLVALATPVEVQIIETSDHFPLIKCRYRLNEVIKGPQSDGDVVTIFEVARHKPTAMSLNKARTAGTQLLVFAKVAEHFHKEIDGKYILVNPNSENARSAYYVNQNVENLYTPDFHALVKFDELLHRSRAQAVIESERKRQHWQGEVRRKALEVPYESDAHQRLYAGSACYLWVPEYIELNQKNGKTKS